VRGEWADFGDDGVLSIIVHPNPCVVARRALGMNDQAGGEASLLATIVERDVGSIAVGQDLDDRAVAQPS
jgi:hypothetical protein